MSGTLPPATLTDLLHIIERTESLKNITICTVCGLPISDAAHHSDAQGLPVCARCWSLPCLWMPDRSDCQKFAAQVRQAATWGISDVRIQGRSL